jgi:hypothetical protein
MIAYSETDVHWTAWPGEQNLDTASPYLTAVEDAQIVGDEAQVRLSGGLCDVDSIGGAPMTSRADELRLLHMRTET